MKRVRRIDEQWLATCRPAHRQEWGVRQHPGLRVRVGPREASFYYYSTEFDSRGRRKRKGYNLGRWPEVSLEAAAEEMRRLREAGPKGRLSERWTVRRVLEDLETQKLNHQRKGFEVAATLRTHAVEARPVKGEPPFGDWRVRQVQKAHLVELVREAQSQTREGSRRWGGRGASRALAKAFRVLFAHAEEVGAVDRNVAASLVAGGAPPRNNWLSTKEQLAAFFDAVDLRALLAGERAPSSLSPVVRLSLAFLAVVPIRKEALRLALWSEVNFERRTWTVPPERQKAPSDEYRSRLAPKLVDLPPTAFAILQLLRKLTPVGSPWVLTSPERRKENEKPEAISEQTQIRALVALQKDGRLTLPRRLTVHDLRRTWASWAASESVGANPLAVELVLDHSLQKAAGLSSSFKTYVHSAMALEEQARALEAVDTFYRTTWDRQIENVERLGGAR